MQFTVDHQNNLPASKNLKLRGSMPLFSNKHLPNGSVDCTGRQNRVTPDHSVSGDDRAKTKRRLVGSGEDG